MSEQNQKKWLSHVDEFPWLKEREELIAEQKQGEGRGEFELNEYGNRKNSLHAPIDEVLKFAHIARRQSEIWEAVQKIVERDKLYPGGELTDDENFFFAFFRDWYLMKHDLAYSPMAFMPVVGLLLQIAHGKIPDDFNNPEVRGFLLESPFVMEGNDAEGEGK